MYKIYIVEDDIGISEALKSLANSWGFESFVCKDFRHVTEEFLSFLPHVVLLDISLPFYNGYHWCKELRKITKVPILFLSSVSDNLNIIMAMNMGADDFISKPFDGNVLVAKIQALLRRSYDFNISKPNLIHKGATLNISENTLIYLDKKIYLTNNEFRILFCLMENCGNIVSREILMERLWETDCFIDDNTLTVNVNRLRKKLDNAGLFDFITTKFGIGYIIE